MKAVFSSLTDEWRTPRSVYKKLDAEFGFTFDPCPLGATDGLLREWSGRAFVNPPYSNVRGFLDKAVVELRSGRLELAVFLVPARTDTRWFHEIALRHCAEIRFLAGRISFEGSRDRKGGAPFPSMLLVFKPAPVDAGERK